MLLFWKKGYESTSVRDLEQATGLVTSSLYNTFGSKEEFFIVILEHYSEFVIGKRIERYLTQEDPIKGIRDFFTTCFTDLPKGNEGIACLLVNSASEMAHSNEGVRKVINKNEKHLLKSLRNCIEKAKCENSLSVTQNSEVLASQLMISLKGLLLNSKLLKGRKSILIQCEQTLDFHLGELN